MSASCLFPIRVENIRKEEEELQTQQLTFTKCLLLLALCFELAVLSELLHEVHEGYKRVNGKGGPKRFTTVLHYFQTAKTTLLSFKSSPFFSSSINLDPNQ